MGVDLIDVMRGKHSPGSRVTQGIVVSGGHTCSSPEVLPETLPERSWLSEPSHAVV